MQINHWGQGKSKRTFQLRTLHCDAPPSIQHIGLLLCPKVACNFSAPHIALADFFSSRCQGPCTLLEFPYQQLLSIRELNTLSLKKVPSILWWLLHILPQGCSLVLFFSKTCSPMVTNLSFSLQVKTRKCFASYDTNFRKLEN